MKVKYASAPTQRSLHSTGGIMTTASVLADVPTAGSSGAKKFPSFTGRPHEGQNSATSGIDAPQYPQEIHMRNKGYQEIEPSSTSPGITVVHRRPLADLLGMRCGRLAVESSGRLGFPIKCARRPHAARESP